MFHSVVAGAVALLGFAGPSAAAGPFALYTVPGVINATDLGTYITCTSTDTAAQDLTVDIISHAGSVAATATATLASKASVMFGTRFAAGLLVDALVAPGTLSSGSAEISSTSKKVICTGLVADAIDTTPTFGADLPLMAKGKQKGD